MGSGQSQLQCPLEDNLDKLTFDLFYTKNISTALDHLILFRMKILPLARGSR
jgi:hypothetical protein